MGDGDRFEEILRETQPQVRAYIAGLGVPSYAVDDVAQEVYLVLYRQLDQVPADATPIQWLKGIARKLCLNYFRKEKRRARQHHEAIVELLARCETPLERVLAEEAARSNLRACLDELTERSRKLVELRYEKNLRSDLIARAMSTTAEAIRIHLHRVRAALRDCLSRKLEGGLA